jgi:hypothetical protein
VPKIHRRLGEYPTHKVLYIFGSIYEYIRECLIYPIFSDIIPNIKGLAQCRTWMRCSDVLKFCSAVVNSGLFPCLYNNYSTFQLVNQHYLAKYLAESILYVDVFRIEWVLQLNRRELDMCERCTGFESRKKWQIFCKDFAQVTRGL